MKRMTLVFLLVMVACVLAGPVENLKPGEWYEVPGSHMEALDPCPSRPCSWSATEGISAVMNDWAGGIMDEKRSRLVVTGGGHSGYAGNELYAFDVLQLKWFRITEPTPNPPEYVDAYPDNTPSSRHTYSGLTYMSHEDRFFLFGGNNYAMCGCNYTDPFHTWTFDFSNMKWENNGRPGAVPSGEKGASSAYDPVSNQVFFYDGSGWSSYDYNKNLWTHHNSDIWFYYRTSVVDPKRRIIVSTGGQGANTATFDLTTPSLTKQNLSTTGDLTIQNSSNVGLAYDPVTEKIIGWNGGAFLYSLDPDTKVWTKLSPAGTNTVTPTAGNPNGTFGRFRYVPSKNVFVAVNQVNEDVFIYRLTSDTAAPQWYLDMIGLGAGVENGRHNAVSTLKLAVLPNPFKGNAVLELGGVRGDATLEAFNVGGRKVMGIAGKLTGRYEWSAKQLPAGVYVLKLRNQGMEFSTKVLIQK